MMVTFIGHSDCYSVKYEEVENLIRHLMKNGVTEFLSGGMGSFDWMAARAVYVFKKEYPHIQNNLIIPYLTFNI